MKNSTHNVHQHSGFLRRLKWLMFLRVVVITFLLGITVFFQIYERAFLFVPRLYYLYFLIGFIYILSLLYVLIMKKIKNLIFFSYGQIFVDLLFVTVLIYVTGGSKSIFTFLYIISIITASILLYRKGGLIAASVASILFGISLDLEYYGIIHPIVGKVSLVSTQYDFRLFYDILINITAFYLVALLSGLLSEEIRESEEALKVTKVDLDKLEVLNKNIVQSINSGILTIDDEGKITTFNRAAEEITGYTFSQVYNVNIQELFSDVSQDLLPQRFETEFKKRDGKDLYLGFSTSILFSNENEELGKILIFQDLTRIKEMEEYVKRMDRLAVTGQLAAGMAHEIRNPLASISGSIQVLKKEILLNDENQRLMNIVVKETERLNRLISDFLSFALPSKRNDAVIDLKDIIEETLALLVNNEEWKDGIKISKNLVENVMLMVDPSQLKQLFWNLFLNASQAMPNGGDLKITTIVVNYTSQSQFLDDMDCQFHHDIELSDEGLFVAISIVDTGYSIPLECQEKIFDPFFTTKERGTGLGLAIVYRIVESYNGKITMKSEESRGTEFIIYLPLKSSREVERTKH